MEQNSNTYDKLLEAINGVRQDVAVLNSQFEEFKNRTAKIDSIENSVIQLTVELNNLKEIVKADRTKTWGLISGIIVGLVVALGKVFLNI